MKRWLGRGLVAAATSAQLACGAARGGPGSLGVAADGNVPGDPGQAAGVAWLGRTFVPDPADPAHVRLSWPGTGFAARFTGTGLVATVRGDARLYAGHQLDTYFDVAVDGGEPVAVKVTTTKTAVPLAAALAPGSHEIWVRKRTEASLGATEIFAVQAVDGALLAPPPLPERRIEVIGASIETGYGVGGVEGVNCDGFSAAQQDQGRAWPQLLADQLGAQLMNTSYSGKGMASNIDISLDPVNTMPVVSRLAEATDFAHLWDSGHFVPDVVAVAMGSNDWEGLGAAAFDANRLVATYVDFVEARRAEAPKATFYVTVSPQIYAQEREDLRAALMTVVAALAARGESGVHYLEFPEYDGAAKSCDGHPPPALHQAMAAQVAARVRADLGW